MLALGLTSEVVGVLEPDLKDGFDFLFVRGIARPLFDSTQATFEELQRLINQAANAFGIAGSIDVDGLIGPVTAQAARLAIGRMTDDLRAGVSGGIRDGDPLALATGAPSAIAVLREAISRKASAPIVATPVVPRQRTQQPIVLPTVTVKADPVATSTAPQTARKLKLVSDQAPTRKGLSTPAFLGVLGLFLLAGGAAAVMVSKRA